MRILTADGLNGIKERTLQRATGPWRIETSDRSFFVFDRNDVCVCRLKDLEDERGLGKENANFIANAPKDIEMLIDEVERLRSVTNDIMRISLGG